MKKLLPYVVVVIAVVGFIILILGNNKGAVRRMDERVTLRQKDKIPYGMAVAKEILPEIFPDAVIHIEPERPGDWMELNDEDSGQAVFIVANYFDPSDGELRNLRNFVRSGNYVFIVAAEYAYDATSFFNIGKLDLLLDDYINNEGSDSLRVKLEQPVFTSDTLFVYPGRKYDDAFAVYDKERTVILGRNQLDHPNFLQMKSGRGSFFIHSAPLAFSNYFILHKQNIRYVENALSVIPSDVHTVVWNEYYLLQPSREEKDPNWLNIMLQNDSFKWAFFTGLGVLALFVLLGMRRKQREIKDHQRPKNDSLDFVKTLGRLYFDQKDHKNLATKMGVYFLDHVRSTYKLPTHTLDEGLEKSLHFKSGFPQQEISNIISTIKRIESSPGISENELADFYKQLELFYQNT